MANTYPVYNRFFATELLQTTRRLAERFPGLHGAVINGQTQSSSFVDEVVVSHDAFPFIPFIGWSKIPIERVIDIGGYVGVVNSDPFISERLRRFTCLFVAPAGNIIHFDRIARQIFYLVAQTDPSLFPFGETISSELDWMATEICLVMLCLVGAARPYGLGLSVRARRVFDGEPGSWSYGGWAAKSEILVIENGLFEALAYFLSFMLARMESSAPALHLSTPLSPVESIKEPSSTTPSVDPSTPFSTSAITVTSDTAFQPHDQRTYNSDLIDRLRNLSPRAEIRLRFLDYMMHRNSASYDELAHEVHGDPLTTESAIRKNVARINEFLASEAETWTFRCGSGYVFKRS